MDKVKRVLFTGLKKTGMAITFGAYDMCLINDRIKLNIIKKLADTFTYKTKDNKILNDRNVSTYRRNP
jgi:hypothetical protein